MTAEGRLPRSVLPRRYELSIAPDLDASTFEGDVAITLDVVEPTDEIVLHAREIEVTLDALEAGGRAVDAALAVVAEDERVVVRVPSGLDVGAATLRLRFHGKISHGLLGFYRSTFAGDDGVEHVLSATQFEPTYARRAFPCFDEPDFKAVFAVTLEVRDDLLAVSNGPEVAREQLAGGKVRVRFGDTIPMSTYLVAWVVGPLEASDAVDAGGVAVRVIHVAGRAHLTPFALDIGSFAIQFFADYYGIPYPGEKCDLVALPDFSFGAMENLGCVTFREVRLLLDPDEVTRDELTAAALTIAHEIAHMWFGDLVTMKWWNGIWLNEAFATFMEHLAVDNYRPEWRTWEDFALDRAAALEIDALSTTRTVEYEVRTPEDADGMFDVLTYQKGGSVLRMLERWLGPDAFRAGVRHYLAKYRLGNTETTDLWDALEEATGQPVRRIMDSWIFQPGYPAIAPADDGGLAQRRFSYSGATGHERWSVPVLTRVHLAGGAETRSMLLDQEPVALDVPEESLVVLNAGGEGFYRVAYPATWRARLIDGDVLTTVERFSLVDDAWAAVLAGEAHADEFVAFTERFARERELVVWRMLLSRLRETSRLVDGDALDRLRARVAALLSSAFAELGWEARPNDDARTRQLRGLFVETMGAFVEDPETIGRAREIERAGGSDADVAAACITVVATGGTADDFERFVAESSNSERSPQEQLRYLHALGSFPAEDLVLRAADRAISDAVRPQNGPFVLARALRNRREGPVAWAYVRDHWDDIRGRFSGSLVTRMVEGVTWLVDDASVRDVPRFLESHPVPEGTRVIAQHVERLRVHRGVLDRERARLEAALGGE
jgi:aminopeptidase N